MAEGHQLTILQKAALIVSDAVVAVLPTGFLKSFAYSMSRRDEGILTTTVTTSNRSWANACLPERATEFEDLTFLFWTTPINRGILRQDLDEAAALYRLVKNLPDPMGVEIGRYSGGSTVMIAAAMAEGKGRLVSIDISPQEDNLLEEALQRLHLSDHVELIVGDANTVDSAGELDFVFIDGDHSYDGAKHDHLRWGAHVKIGGYIVHHDMGRGRQHSTEIPALARLKRDIIQQQANELEIEKEIGSMVFFRRISDKWTAF